MNWLSDILGGLFGSSSTRKKSKRWCVVKGRRCVSTHYTKTAARKAANKVKGRLVKYRKGMKVGSNYGRSYRKFKRVRRKQRRRQSYGRVKRRFRSRKRRR